MLSSVSTAAVLDLRGSDLGTMRAHLPAGRSPKGTDHLYVLQFGTLTKIGMTNNPKNRFVFHRNSHLRTIGGPLVRAWVSAAHAAASENEDALRHYCRQVGGMRWGVKHEIFTDLTDRVDLVIAEAARLALADPTLTFDWREAPASQRYRPIGGVA